MTVIRRPSLLDDRTIKERNSSLRSLVTDKCRDVYYLTVAQHFRDCNIVLWNMKALTYISSTSNYCWQVIADHRSLQKHWTAYLASQWFIGVQNFAVIHMWVVMNCDRERCYANNLLCIRHSPQRDSAFYGIKSKLNWRIVWTTPMATDDLGVADRYSCMRMLRL
jgi:hypothetical protein